MTLLQGAELIQNLVKNGVLRGKETLKKEHYVYLVSIARDYILFQKNKTSNNFTTNNSVVSLPKTYKIEQGVISFPNTFNPQGIVSFEILSGAKQEIDITLFPLYAGAKTLVNNIFSYYIPLANGIEFKNLPNNAKYAKIYSIAGADLNDNISNDIMFLILKEVTNLGNISEQKRKDTSADGNTTDDILQAQIRTQTNVPNQII